MISYREYKILKGLYELTPKMDEKQKYGVCSPNEVALKSNLDEVDVIAYSDALAQQGYIKLAQSTDPEKVGYLHIIALTPKGASAVLHFCEDWWGKQLHDLIIPAIVSFICSVLCAICFG